MTYMKTGRLPSYTKGFASINKRNVFIVERGFFTRSHILTRYKASYTTTAQLSDIKCGSFIKKSW